MTRPEIEQIHRNNRRSIILIVVLLVATVIVSLASLSVSTIDIGFWESFQIIIDHLNGVEPSDFRSTLKDTVVFSENVPRVLGALIAGAVLSISGALLQSLIRNPLAEPYTLGISSGAMFGMVLSVGLGFSIVPFLSSSDGMIINAFVFSLIPTTVVILVAMFKKVTPTMMILCGIGVMYVFTALTTLVKYSVDPDTLSSIYQWSIGSVSGLSYGSIEKMLIALAIAVVPLFFIHRRVDIVAQGDETAISLGINPNRLRIVTLVFVSMATAIVVCYTGTISFVGLVAPHIARRVVGNTSKYMIPASAVIGSLMVVSADYIVHEFTPTLPVGVILALVCSPIFIYILIKMKKNSW